jgi:hypothetical protein
MWWRKIACFCQIYSWKRLIHIMLFPVILSFSHSCGSFLSSRLLEEDHRAGKIIQVHQGRRYYDRRGTMIVLIDCCIGKCCFLLVPTSCAILILEMFVVPLHNWQYYLCWKNLYAKFSGG